VAHGQIGGGVVDVEAQADRDARTVRPRLRVQPLAGADVKHLRFDLIQRQLCARLRMGLSEKSSWHECKKLNQQPAICNLQSHTFLPRDFARGIFGFTHMLSPFWNSLPRHSGSCQQLCSHVPKLWVYFSITISAAVTRPSFLRSPRTLYLMSIRSYLLSLLS